MGTQTTTREAWRSADHPASEREAFDGAQRFETAEGAPNVA